MLPSESNNNHILQLHTFAKEEISVRSCCCRRRENRRKHRVISLASVSQNLAVTWQRKLLWALDDKPYSPDSEPEQRKILVLINPFGGAGAATAAWNLARPFLEKAHIQLTVKLTEHRNHAYEIVHNDLMAKEFDSIVTVSGDGLIHEIVNGLLTRDDWKDFKDTITLGCIPGGTGNGLVKSLLVRDGE